MRPILNLAGRLGRSLEQGVAGLRRPSNRLLQRSPLIPWPCRHDADGVEFDSQVDSHAGRNQQTAADKTASPSAILRLPQSSANVHRLPTNRLLISRFSVRVR
jgi:hypothetical protein